MSRRGLGYVSRRDDGAPAAELRDSAASDPRYGCRRLCVMLRRAGRAVNLKRVRRLCREHGLLLGQKRRRKRRGAGGGAPCRAGHPGHVWAYDFAEDRAEGGRELRVLTVEGEFARECVAVGVECRVNARRVADTLPRLLRGRGTPRLVRPGSGPEFVAKHLMRALAGSGVEARHIEPGSPWRNGRPNGTLRGECLDPGTSHNRDHARAPAKLFGRQYDERRPHSSVGYPTPGEFAGKWKASQRAGAPPAATR